MLNQSRRMDTLSVIMPFYRKYADFRQVLPLNYEYLSKDHIEVILSLDEDHEEKLVLSLIQNFPKVKWKVIVCHEPHEWRNPTKAINVGLKHARGNNVLIVSPESAFVDDLPDHMLMHLSVHQQSAICGRLHCSTFRDLAECKRPYEAMLRYIYRQGPGLYTRRNIELFYGSIMVSRSSAVNICGYDECLVNWGGDDDNFRARLRLAGIAIVKTRNVNILHLSDSPEPRRKRITTKAETEYILRPAKPKCPVCSPRWGQAFNDVVYDWWGQVKVVDSSWQCVN